MLNLSILSWSVLLGLGVGIMVGLSSPAASSVASSDSKIPLLMSSFFLMILSDSLLHAACPIQSLAFPLLLISEITILKPFASASRAVGIILTMHLLTTAVTVRICGECLYASNRTNLPNNNSFIILKTLAIDLMFMNHSLMVEFSISLSVTRDIGSFRIPNMVLWRKASDSCHFDYHFNSHYPTSIN